MLLRMTVVGKRNFDAILAFLHDVEATVAANFVDADEHAVTFTLGVFIQFGFSGAAHDLLTHVALPRPRSQQASS